MYIITTQISKFVSFEPTKQIKIWRSLEYKEIWNINCWTTQQKWLEFIDIFGKGLIIAVSFPKNYRRRLGKEIL